MTKKDALNWFEIYVGDMTRARKFYETILQVPMPETNYGASPMAMFPFDMGKGVGGSLTMMDVVPPGPGGTLIYLNVDGDLDGVISRIPAAGGRVLRPRLSIGEHGFIAVFKDTEGNVVGLHSQQ
jgi:predicted enzyme related to lactoylglutathione lyase